VNTLRRLRWPAVGVFLYAACLVVWAPARWAGIAAAYVWGGQVRFSGARGTLWDGSADLHLHAPGCDAPVPLGRWSWRVLRDEGAALALAVREGGHPWARVARADGAWGVRALRADVTAEALCALPAVAAYRPSGTLAIGIEDGRLADGRVSGRVCVDWRHAGIGAVSATPAGDHRFRVESSGQGPVLVAMEPLGGPLRVAARGEWSPALGLRAQGEIALGEGGDAFRAWLASGTRALSSDRFAFTLDLRTAPLAAGHPGPRTPRS
jgi:general secretion pathway protein N